MLASPDRAGINAWRLADSPPGAAILRNCLILGAAPELVWIDILWQPQMKKH